MTFLDWLSSSISTTALLGVIGFLARHWIIDRLANSIKYSYEKELETHKADLKRDYDVQIEKLKSELAEKNFRFSHVFEQTTKAISDTHHKLLEVHLAAQKYVELLRAENSNDRESDLAILQQRVNEFGDYYRRNKIFIPKITAKKIDQVFGNIISLARTFNISERVSRARVTNSHVLERYVQRLEDLREDVPKLLESLEDEFQQILGFSVGKAEIPGETSEGIA
jgi:hypothetical protein